MCFFQIHKIQYSPNQPNSQRLLGHYQNLVFQQRNKSRLFVNSLRVRRAEMSFTPNAMSCEEQSGAQNDVPQQTCHNFDQNIIHDAFMDTNNFFSNTGFASGSRG